MESEINVGKRGKLYREGQPITRGKVLAHEPGRDAGDFLIEFADGGDGRTGVVTRAWFVLRPQGTHENGTFEVN